MDKSFLKALNYFQKGNFKNAEQPLRKCISKNKNHFDAIHLLALVFVKTNRAELSLEYFNRALAIKHNVPELCLNYTNTLLQLGEINQALIIVNKMLINLPKDLKLLEIKARALSMLGQNKDAIKLYMDLYTLTYDANILLEQAKCEGKLANWQQASTLTQQALEATPHSNSAHDLMVECLYELKQFKKLILYCLQFYKQFSPLNYQNVFKYAYSALFFSKEKLPDTYFDDLHKLAPRYPDNMLTFIKEAIHKPIYSSVEEITKYRKHYLKQLKSVEPIDKNDVYLKGFRPLSHFYLGYQGHNNRYINECLSSLYPAPVAEELKTSHASKKKILIVSDLIYDTHIISALTLGLITNLANGNFDITVWVPSDDKHIKIKKLCETGAKVDIVAEDVSTICKKALKLRPDFIYYPEIGMSGLIYSLAHSRLAPIQFTSWGHPETTGINTIDYYISSQLIEPKNACEHYSEKLIELSKLPAIYSRVILNGELSTHMDAYYNNTKYITCMQSLFKFHPDFDAIIKNILDRNLQIKLFLLNQASSDLLTERLITSGIDVKNRVVFLPKMSRKDFLHFYSKSTVALDPIHFGGGNTVYEAMSLDVPVVTWPGDFMRSRITAGAYHQMGINTLIADSPEMYVDIVTKLLQDDEFNRLVRQEIQENKEALFDTHEVAQELEKKLLGLTKNVE